MNRALLAMTMLLVPVFGQNPTIKRPTVDEQLQLNHTYEFQNVDAGRGMEITQFVQSLVSQAVGLEYFRTMKTVVIRPYNAGDLDKVVALLKKYDVPPPIKPEVEFTAYLVMASTPAQTERFFQPGPRGTPFAAPLVPAELQSAITQMKQTLADRKYWLRDTIVTRVRDTTSIDGLLEGFGAMAYSLSYGDIKVSAQDQSIHIDPFRFSVKPCTSGTCAASGITTDTVIREGQKLVFGKISTPGGGDMFVVLTARIQEAK
jgi:hypothetical protein